MLPCSPDPPIGIIQDWEGALTVVQRELIVLLDDFNEGGIPPVHAALALVVEVYSVKEAAVRSSREDRLLVHDPQDAPSVRVEVYQPSTTLIIKPNIGLESMNEYNAYIHKN